MRLSDIFTYFLLILPFINKVAPSARGRAILHRLNKPLLLLANNRTNFSRIHSQKPSMPVFNYGGSNFIGRENELGNGTEGGGGGEEDGLVDPQRQMLTALPDLSDPCFRRYANSIIVNAQPYERRSSISLIHCKLQCLRSQLGIYSCRSVVYDNVNQVCDLFAHVGDQSPAKLLRFQTRDYFEPTAAIHCVPPPPSQPIGAASDDQFSPAMGVQQTLVPPAAVPTLVSGPIVWPTPPPSTVAATTLHPSTTTLAPLSAKTTTSFEPEEEEEEETGTGTGTGLTLLKPSEEEGDEENGEEEENEDSQQQRLGGARQHSSSGDGGNGNEGPKPKGCLPGQVPRFLRTKDFELFGQDQHRMTGIQSEQRCLELCADQGNASFPMPIQCNSLEYTPAHEECVFSTETAVPVGNGQLRQRPGTDYLERVCVDQKLASECRNNIYRRFPQMILVGFAETVIDSASLQQCLDNCLNSQQLYGFRCSSGMFYFEEPQLNCILNTEDRESQPDLFTTETSDLVDYFETGCPEGRMAMPKMQQAKNGKGKEDYEDETNEGGARKRAPNAEGFVQRTRRERLGWTQWTVCTARSQWTTLGIQARWRVCAGGRVCGKEERQCILGGSAGRKASGNSGGRQNGRAGGGLVTLNAQRNIPAQNGQRELRREQRKVGALAAIGTATKWNWAKGGGGQSTTTRATTLRKGGDGANRLGAPAMNGRERERAQPRKCRPEAECCPLLGSCRLGIRFGGQKGKDGANWCKNPCG